jgi:nondiscriminating aspartyl-tRNA synthetase
MKKQGLNPDEDGYKAYLSAFKFGLPPHGGFGLGLERLTARIIGLKNVKEASLFPRDINRLAP